MKITLKEWLKANGYATSDDALAENGCEVGPDGHCPHGAPSLLLAMGLI